MTETMKWYNEQCRGGKSALSAFGHTKRRIGVWKFFFWYDNNKDLIDISDIMNRNIAKFYEIFNMSPRSDIHWLLLRV